MHVAQESVEHVETFECNSLPPETIPLPVKPCNATHLPSASIVKSIVNDCDHFYNPKIYYRRLFTLDGVEKFVPNQHRENDSFLYPKHSRPFRKTRIYSDTDALFLHRDYITSNYSLSDDTCSLNSYSTNSTLAQVRFIIISCLFIYFFVFFFIVLCCFVDLYTNLCFLQFELKEKRRREEEAEAAERAKREAEEEERRKAAEALRATQSPEDRPDASSPQEERPGKHFNHYRNDMDSKPPKRSHFFVFGRVLKAIFLMTVFNNKI